jgi:hypothetical protein
VATQTEGQVQTEIRDRIAILQEIRKMASVNSSGPLSNYIAREETALDDPEGDFTTISNASLKVLRGLLAQSVDSSLAASVLDPLWRNYAKVIGDITERDGPGILRRLYLNFIANSKTVNSRDINFGSVAAGSNIGSGTINRLTVDSYGYDIEACHMETKKARCFFDEATGAERDAEQFIVEGETAQVDQLYIEGSNFSQLITALAAKDGLLTNASFSEYAGALTLPTEISGWTPGSGAAVFTNLDIDETYTYRPAGGTSDPTPRSLKFTGSEYVTQTLRLNGQKLNPDLPIYAQLAYNRSQGSALGWLIFSMGSVSVTVQLVAQSGWQILRIPLNKMLFPRNFASVDNPTIKIQFIRTSGDLYVDDVCIAPMDNVDGTWIKIVGGATPFVGVNRDSFSWTDALNGSDSIIQQWLWRVYGQYLPHADGGAETWADPTV